MTYSFQPLAQTPVQGYMQAVSDDGKAVIYRSSSTVYLYYFDGEVITTQNHTMEFTIDKPEEFYTEERSYHHTLVKVIDKRVLVYISLSPYVIKVDFPDYRESQAFSDFRMIPEDVLDIAIDPISHSLVSLCKLHLYYSFQMEMPLNIDMFENDILQGKIQIHKEGTLAYFYLFFVLDTESSKLAVVKVEETTHMTEYNLVDYNQTVFSVEKDFDVFSGIKYDERNQIFCIAKDHLNQPELERMRLKVFMDKDLNFLEMKGRISSTWFHSFMQGTDSLILGNIYFWDDVEDFALIRTCIVPYEVQEGAITFRGENQRCEDGFYDRVSSWQMGNQTYLLTHIDRFLDVRTNIGEQELAVLEARAFSTKMPDTLIIEQHGELMYTQWRQINQEENQTQITNPKPECESCIELGIAPFVIICAVLGLVIILSIILGILLCKKNSQPTKKESETGENFGKTESNNNIMTPSDQI